MTPTMVAGETSAPERSLVQRMDALDEANRIRTFRAGLKRDVKAGKRTVQEILRAPMQEVETMKLFDLLLAAPKIGRVKANRALVQCRVSPSKTVGGLSERQRMEVLAFLVR
jgi:hypothetical protein